MIFGATAGCVRNREKQGRPRGVRSWGRTVAPKIAKRTDACRPSDTRLWDTVAEDVLSCARLAFASQHASSFRQAKLSRANILRHQPCTCGVFESKQRAGPFATDKSQQSIKSDTRLHEIVAIHQNDTLVASQGALYPDLITNSKLRFIQAVGTSPHCSRDSCSAPKRLRIHVE